ncbi:MAG: cobalt-precorrin-5B (C(1))-methyltransferase CbiD [Thermosediminibacteraceae bacterium]|nr:cobalt-precorrin-5B (C(1))-methyltransferase CbiD [Thermosediminibacteraceae bacterium]PZN04947.1 MAG: cobalamin biosynthesis protein CbiD [Bacillota bacterium]
MVDFVLKDGKKLRLGYTTGSCAAASAKAATIALFSGSAPEYVKIETPAGKVLTIKVEEWENGGSWARCAVKKDGGDDPDVTHGLLVWAGVEKTSSAGIEITAGEGIGIVTKPGLPVKPGKPAINPKPMEMITKEVSKVLPEGEGVRVILSIPGGEKVAEKTFNPRLGIIGGLSILGTTGIVTPMSTESLKETLALELSVLSAEGAKSLVIVPGNYGRDFARKLGFDDALIVSCGNFIGFALDKAVEYGFKKVNIIGEIGKLIKVSAGIFDTANRIADARTEIITAYAALFGVAGETLKKLMDVATTAGALEILEKNNIELKNFCSFIAERVLERCLWYTRQKIGISVYLVSRERGLLAVAGE